MRLDGVPQAIAWCAFLTVCLGPFLFGALERSVWIPLSELWLGVSLLSALARSRSPSTQWPTPGPAISRALLPIHALFAVQLVPLPKAVLHALAPGSYAAHYLPDPLDGRLRALSVSPSATLEAWLYFAGLQGLLLALLGLPPSKRRPALYALIAVIGVVAGEGLWQSRTPHPAWLYGRIPVVAPLGLESGTFGPYSNRNHFATLMAMGAGLAAGLAAVQARECGGMRRLLVDPAAAARIVLLSGAALVFVLVCAASGSRSGTFAAVCAIGIIAAKSLPSRWVLPPLGLGLAALALTGASAIERLLRLDIVEARVAPWLDMTNLFRFFPFFGCGIGAFAAAYWPYQMNARFEFWQHAHNEYLEWLIEGGVLGVLAVVFSARSLRRGVRFGEGEGQAVKGALIAFAVQCLLDFPARIPANAAVLVCMLALGVAPRVESHGQRSSGLAGSPPARRSQTARSIL